MSPIKREHATDTEPFGNCHDDGINQIQVSLVLLDF